jgi:prophage regulatory protein
MDGIDLPDAPADRPKAGFSDPVFSGPKGENANNAAVTLSAARAQPNDDEFWSFKAVVAKTGLSRSSIYAYVARGIFPRQRRLGPRRVGWLASEVRAWMASRPC